MIANKLVLATHNSDKVAELRDVMAAAGLELMSLAAFPGAPQVTEDGETLADNAVKKAQEYARFTGFLTLAEDTGLMVDALAGRPGVNSARFAATDDARIQRVLAELAGVPTAKRTARFVTVAALCRPDGTYATFSGTLNGFIALAPSGSGGFGYDPIFLLADGRTLAGMSRAEKNAISHRGQAIRQVLAALPSFLAAG